MKKAICIAMVLCMCLAVFGCSATATKSEPKLRNGSGRRYQAPAEVATAERRRSRSPCAQNLTNEYFVAMKDARGACDKSALRCFARTYGKTMNHEQIAMFETMMQKGFDGILIDPNGTDEIVSSGEQQRGGNPVICWIPMHGATCCPSSAPTITRRLSAGEWVGNPTPQRTIITGVPAPLHTDRTQGLNDGIANNPNVKLVAEPVPGTANAHMHDSRELITGIRISLRFYCCNDQWRWALAKRLRPLLDRSIAVSALTVPPTARRASSTAFAPHPLRRRPRMRNSASMHV